MADIAGGRTEVDSGQAADESLVGAAMTSSWSVLDLSCLLPELSRIRSDGVNVIVHVYPPRSATLDHWSVVLHC